MIARARALDFKISIRSRAAGLAVTIFQKIELRARAGAHLTVSACDKID